MNLRAPGIAFTVTPQSGPLETTSATTSQFATNMRVRVAVNTNFFSPCCNAVAVAELFDARAAPALHATA